MSKLYLVTYTPGITFSRTGLHNHIEGLFKRGFITDWWHYIDTTYIVTTSLDVSQLYNAIFPGVPGQYLLIVEIDSNNAQGWLPKDAWTWLQKYQVKT